MYNILSIGRASLFVMPLFLGGCRLFGCPLFALVSFIYIYIINNNNNWVFKFSIARNQKNIVKTGRFVLYFGSI
jgi:hypothetical protein